MYLCSLHQAGEILLHRHMQASPEPWLKALAPSRDDLVIAVEGVFPWDWLADLGAREGLPFVRGHALSMTAIHGGTAKNDQMDAQKIALLLRGGMLPQAYGSPAELRATRDLLRRRRSLTRTRAELLAPIQHPNRQSNLPESGQKRADTATRTGVAARFPAPAVPKSLAGALALMGYDAPLRSAVE